MRIPYGISHFGQLREQDCLYVDKTAFIPRLEDLDRGRVYLVFLRPRRFGKSTLLSMLDHYYDRDQAARFSTLFGGLYIHDHPTPERNRYLTLRLEFTGINTDGSAQDVQRSVCQAMRPAVHHFCSRYRELVPELAALDRELDFTDYPASLMARLLGVLQAAGQQLYLFVDEYDNATNLLISSGRHELYAQVTQDGGFLRELYKTFKAGTATGVIRRIFLTGVSPITLDDLSSGANIFQNVSLEEDLATMAGFTQAEVEALADAALREGRLRLDRGQLLRDLRRYYNGYRFSEDCAETVYNPDMVLYFFSKVRPPERYPRVLLDDNVRTDYGKLRNLLFTPAGEPRPGPIEAVRSLVETGAIEGQVLPSFPLERAFSGDFFVSLLYYLGLVTLPGSDAEALRLTPPNQVIRELHHDALAHILADLAQVQVNTQPLVAAVRAMAFDGEIAPFLHFLYERVIRLLSRRDLIQLNERSMKFITLSQMALVDVFAPFSEMENMGGYSDLWLPLNRRRYPAASYSYLLELKYVRSQDGERRVEAALQEAEAQLARYHDDPRMAHFAGPKGWRRFAVVFLGSEAICYRAADASGGATRRVPAEPAAGPRPA